MKRVMTVRSNASSNCPFGLFLSEQICSSAPADYKQPTFASILFGAMPAEMVSSVLASTSARSCVTTSAAVMLCEDMYAVMLQRERDSYKPTYLR